MTLEVKCSFVIEIILIILTIIPVAFHTDGYLFVSAMIILIVFFLVWCAWRRGRRIITCKKTTSLGEIRNQRAIPEKEKKLRSRLDRRPTYVSNLVHCSNRRVVYGSNTAHFLGNNSQFSNASVTPGYTRCLNSWQILEQLRRPMNNYYSEHIWK